MKLVAIFVAIQWICMLKIFVLIAHTIYLVVGL